jgi:hypothetical protein
MPTEIDNAREHQRTPMDASPNMQTASPAPNVAAQKAKVRPKAIIRFPYQVHGGITPAMNRAIERLTAGNSLMAAADVIRMALHGYLLSNDPRYHQDIGGNRNA